MVLNLFLILVSIFLSMAKLAVCQGRWSDSNPGLVSLCLYENTDISIVHFSIRFGVWMFWLLS